MASFNYDELAAWYEEARYTFRRIEYACKNNKFAECFQLGWYLQVELDILTEEAALDKMDLLGSYDADDLTPFEKRNRKICEKHKAGSFLEELADLFNLSVETIRKIIYRK